VARKRDDGDAAIESNEPAEVSSEESPPEQEAAPPPGPMEPEESQFAYEVLMAQSRQLFGVSRSTFAGAIKKHGGLYKVSEVKKRLSEWLAKEVKK